MNSAEKTAALLKLLGLAPYVHGVTELGEKIGCSKSGTYKLLAALVQNGLAAQTLDRKYTLGPAVYILGKTYEDRIGLSRMIRPYLIRLRDLTGENASFSMLVGGKANLIYREESLQLVRVAPGAASVRRFHRKSAGGLSGRGGDPPPSDGRATHPIYPPYHHLPPGPFGGVCQHPQAGVCHQ